jgi:uncharacterized membrane protein YgcG
MKWTTKELKIEGEKIHNVQPSQQRLISMGKLLQEDKTLEEQGITLDGSIIHLFPKPNVIISNCNADDDNDNDANTLSPTGLPPLNNEGGGSNGGGGAHVPQIVLNSAEVSQRSQILVLSSHEAYEAMNRVRLMSFLLLAYCTLQILRDVTEYLTPPDDTTGGIIPPRDPTDTSSSTYNEENALPQWQNRDYVELAISALGVYTALLGMKATTEHVGSLARKFIILLGILGASWTLFTPYCHIIDNLELEKALGESDEGHLALHVSLLETTLPFFLWVLFYMRAWIFYAFIREAEQDAADRGNSISHMRDLLRSGNMTSSSGGGNNADNDGTTAMSNANENYDLELQVEGRTIA